MKHACRYIYVNMGGLRGAPMARFHLATLLGPQMFGASAAWAVWSGCWYISKASRFILTTVKEEER